MTRKPIYIIHPFKGKGSEHQDNLIKILAICRMLAMSIQGIVLVNPVLNFLYLDDNDPEERALAIEMGQSLIRMIAAVGGEVWVFVPYKDSEGCLGEIKLAEELGVTIRYWDQTEVSNHMGSMLQLSTKGTEAK